MLSIAHSATGAIIAAKVQNPFLYVPIVLALHYLQDFIPHWDVGTGLTNGSRKRIHAFFLEWIDLVLSAGLIFALYPLPSSLDFSSLHPYIGAFIALVPDFLEFPINFLHWDIPLIKPINNFHHRFHHSTPNVFIGLLPQIALILLITLLH